MAAETPEKGLEIIEELEDGSGGADAERRARAQDPAAYLVHRFLAHQRAADGAARVWKRLSESRAKAAPAPVPPSAWSRPAAVFAIAALAVALFVVGRGRTRPGFELAVANRSKGLAVGEALRVPAGESAQLSAGSLLHVALKEHALVGVTGLSADPAGALSTFALTQDAGRAIYAVTPGAGLVVSIVTPHATVRVVGTKFRVSVDERGTQVDVGAGTVDVAPPAGAPVRLTAGRSLAVRAGEAPGQPATFNRIADPDLGSGVTPITGRGN